ncbi:MAG: hypothetical protein LBQ46_00550 [Treponema sp.]|jgi:hypothetical protein|nr:hypothetical protein [Treponema sp.]
MTAVTDRTAYRKVVETLKRRRKGLTAADLAAATALPLAAAREQLSRAADEFRGRLKVTESSEILYEFPQGFTSRYTSLGARLGRFMDKFVRVGAAFLSWLFKAWILVMLLGYFALFMLIALAALFLSVAGNSSNSNSRSRSHSGGGFILASHVFDLIIRLWFYSELTKSLEGSYRGRPVRNQRRSQPLHRAVFSFVFGEKDAVDAEAAERRALIAYLCANRGIISLPEYMALTGAGPLEAEERILGLCADAGGYPEATEEGTIVYRFQDIMRRADKGDRSFAGEGLSAPLTRLRSFSANSKTMNAWFGIINSVNLLFGGYFFYQALTTGVIRSTEHLQASPRIYGITYALATALTDNPQPVLLIGLGLVPLVFSFFFWVIPALRYIRLGRQNQGIKRRNLRKIGFRKIWEKLRGVSAADIDNPAPECRPEPLAAEQEKIIAEMGAYSQPEVEADESGKIFYNFTELEREKKVLASSRAAVNSADFDLGKVVFDSGQ